MAVQYGKFELPNKLKIDEKTRRSTFARFIAEPFERGFGHTIGNSLRRVMLSCLEAPSIVSVKLEGVAHEFMSIEGVIEDMTHVILNLKNALLRRLPLDENGHDTQPRHIVAHLDVTHEMLEKHRGSYPVTLGFLFADSVFEVINPDHVIFTVTKPMTKRIDLKVKYGRGYVPSERQEQAEKIVDEIVIDSIYSPVSLVNYYVENTRVGQDTDFDRLILEVSTDGRITPEEALSFASQIATLHFKPFETAQANTLSFENLETHSANDIDTLMSKLALKINEIELSVRSTNCLAGANIDTIAELVIMPESEMLKFRNFGKKSLNEIKEKLEELGLYLGMDLSKFGVTRDNVKQVIDDYLNTKNGEEE
jgi:DNA-directed RNA polymerase subunit alpha